MVPVIKSALRKVIQEPVEALFGRLDAWQKHREAIRTRPTVKQALQTIRDRWTFHSDIPADDPVMIFSAGWRSGSTLLQRLALSGNEVLIWGEPYTYSDYIRTMAASLTCITSSMPPDQFFLGEPPGFRNVDPEAWTACMYPHPQNLLNAHRSFFWTLYRDPAMSRGYTRWGLKEVVLSTQEAAYLRWLFPAAKIVFLYRNPYDAYRSYRSFGDWYFHWPDAPVFTAARFGKVWRTLVEDFEGNSKDFGGLLLRYEDLLPDGAALDRLSRHLGTTISSEIATSKVTGRPPGQLPPIPRLELQQLRRAVEPVASRLGYQMEP